jgi:SAM-dependent methyltransferase
MYRLQDYANMLRDRARTLAYKAAIDQVVGPDSVVLDLGAGTGAFALYAAQRGARRVYAVESNPLIDYGRREAQRLGLADRMLFHCGRSEEFAPPEPANVLISDLRGSLPFLGDAFATLADARRRLLTPDAVLMPTIDRLYVAPVQDENWYETQISRPWLANDLELPMPLLGQAESCMPRRPPQGRWDPLLPGQSFGQIDYRGTPGLPPAAALEWLINEAAKVHAWLLWFEAELIPGVTISAAPGAFNPWVYGRLVLPLQQPVDLQAGDRLGLRLRVLPVGGDFAYAWSTSRHSAGGEPRDSFNQHSAHELFLPANRGELAAAPVA